MNLKRASAVFGFVIAAAGISYWGAKQVFIRAFATTDLKVRPYVAWKIDFVVAEGKEVTTAQTISVRRRDGASVQIATMYPARGAAITARRVDFPDGYAGTIIDSIRAKMTGRKSAVAVDADKATLMNSPGDCAYPGEKVQGEGNTFGYHVVQVVSGNDTARFVSWRLPDFSCMPVQTVLQNRSSVNGTWQTTNGSRVVSFIQTDPDPRIFTGWDGYSEEGPSDLRKKLMTNSGITPQQCPNCFADDPKGDALYTDWHARLIKQP